MKPEQRGVVQRVKDFPRRAIGRYVVPARRHAELARAHEELAARNDALAHAHQDLERRFDDLSKRYHEADHVRRTYQTWVPPGHFYSPYADLAEVEARAERIFDTAIEPLGIDLRDGDQVELFEVIADAAERIPFPSDPGDDYRYHFDNPAYSWGDGTVLHALLRHVRPARVVEVGSGYSSALMLDTADGWLGGDVRFTFVEPYPELLESLMKPGDEQRATVLDQAVQDVPLELFTGLQAGDLLFIDSTHVVKAGSDVNHLFFEVLPRLNAGVWVHIHDVFFPFEYRLDWLQEGRAWQEIYLLRAFLMHNPTFEIRWFQHYMWTRHRQLLESRVPWMAKDPGGNLWLQRTTAP